MTTTLALNPLPPLTALTRDRTADRKDRVGLALSELFASRHDLKGVCGVADVLAEDLLWSV